MYIKFDDMYDIKDVLTKIIGRTIVIFNFTYLILTVFAGNYNTPHCEKLVLTDDYWLKIWLYLPVYLMLNDNLEGTTVKYLLKESNSKVVFYEYTDLYVDLL